MPPSQPPKPTPRQEALPERLLGSRILPRIFTVLGILALVASWRLDQAVATAYRTGWVPPRFAARQEQALFGCGDCWRLPSDEWLWASALIGGVALVLLLVAALLVYAWHSEEPDGRRGRSAGGGHHEVRGLTNGPGAAALPIAVAIATVVIAIVDVVIRYLAARGEGFWLLTLDAALQGAALLGLAVLVVAGAAGSRRKPRESYEFLERVGRFLYRQRVNVVGVLLLGTAMLVVGQTSGQAIDSIRTWGFGSTHAIARLGFGVGATLLLSLVIYESAVQLTQVKFRERTLRAFRWRRWLAGGLALAALGVLLAWFGPFGYGLVVVGGIAVLLALLGLEADEDAKAKAGTIYDERVAEILAVAPLLFVAATGVAAAIDAGLSRGKAAAFGPLVPTAILAAAAIVMTAERPPRRFVTARRRVWLASLALVVLASLLLVIFESEIGAAAVALIGCALALGYAGWLFHRQPPREGKGDLCCAALSLPSALWIGLGLFVAVHWDALGSTATIGTLALVSFAVAFWLAVLNWLVLASFHRKPPRALARVGFQQLPILTLVALAWVATALVAPATRHETRLAARQAITGERGQAVIPAAPTLAEAFQAWVRAQPELQGGSGGGDPVPMFLVSGHGGGIRASYWTALALDCVVGVSSSGFDPAALRTGDETAREATCQSRRRSAEEQQAAARRIFVVSGVSGGSVGFYAYARQLIALGSLGDGSWVDERLGGDFASATVGWGLFHDATNNWLGLHSHRGGGCAWAIATVCMTADRAAIHEQAFDARWPEGSFPPLLRLAWDMRETNDEAVREVAETVPLLVANTTVTGGKARGVVSAANLGAWPTLDALDPGRGAFDTHPLAGTVEVVEAACATQDVRLSTAAVLSARFPYVSPAGHVSGQCRRSEGEPHGADKSSTCANVAASTCEMRLVDGGYADNSGLLTIGSLWPSLRELVLAHNRSSGRDIAPVFVELDNHYRARLDEELAATGVSGEAVVPVLTAFGARTSIETFARALAYRLRPPGCTVTISPGLHPGLTAPLGWELSPGAREDLRAGLVRPHPGDVGERRYRALFDLRRLQQWIGAEEEHPVALSPPLATCVPTDTPPALKR